MTLILIPSLTPAAASTRLKTKCPQPQVVPAQYAFVVHTANPLTGERGELFGEVIGQKYGFVMFVPLLSVFHGQDSCQNHFI